jgi:hypothetical protein
MGDIERIDAARGGVFEFRHDGEIIALSSPADLNFQQVLAALKDPRHLTYVRMAEWKRAALRDQWAARYDLPEFRQAQRLCYVVDRYSAALTYDLHSHAGVDLLELWHARRWRTLLDIIDRLPSYSTYAATVATDEEHAKMLAEAMAERKREEGDDAEKGPPIHTWTPEVEALFGLRDDVRNLGYVIRATNGDKSAKPPKPLPRPMSALQEAMKRAEFKRREKEHKSLVARFLPHKAQNGDTS